MSAPPLCISPAGDSALGLGSLLRNGAALAAGLFDRVAAPDPDLPRGDGRTVLVIPAFLAGDWATARLRGFLNALGYRAEPAHVAVNLGPTPDLVASLERSFLALSAERAVDVVGQSLGGVLARDLARRHPGRVRRLVTLCSPIRVPITTPLAPGARLFERFWDRAWMERRSAIADHPGVPTTALYSTRDGVVNWRECLQAEGPDARNVAVDCAHATVGSDPQALRAVAEALSW